MAAPHQCLIKVMMGSSAETTLFYFFPAAASNQSRNSYLQLRLHKIISTPPAPQHSSALILTFSEEKSYV